MDEQAGRAAHVLGGGDRAGQGRAPRAASGGGGLQRLDRGRPDHRLRQHGSLGEGARGGEAPGLGDQLGHCACCAKARSGMPGRRATKILTPAEWATFPARREQARRALMAEERISFAEVVRYRAWWLAPEDLKARVETCPHFEDEAGTQYDLPAAPGRGGRAAAPQGGGGGDRGADQGRKAPIRPRRQECLRQAQELASTRVATERGGGPWRPRPSAPCSSWSRPGCRNGWSGAGRSISRRPSSRGRWRCCRRSRRNAWTSRAGSWSRAGDRSRMQLRREIRPDKLQALQVEIASCQLFIRVFLARKAIIEVFGQELGLDLVTPAGPGPRRRPSVTSSPSTTSWRRGAGRASRTRTASWLRTRSCCQTARNFDPRSASNVDPRGRLSR